MLHPAEADLTRKPVNIVVAAVAVGLLVGCAERRSGTQQGAIDEAVFAAMAAASYESVRQAFDDLKGRAYSVVVDTREMDDAGNLIAQSVERFESSNQGVRSATGETAADQPFSDGFLSFLTERDSAVALSHAPLLPDRPAFAELRMREQFSYASRRDTTVSQTTVRLYESRAVVPPSKQPIRFARIGVSERDSTLLYVHLKRHDDTIFYEEQSVAELTLAHDSTGVIVPARKVVEVTVDVPFQPARTFVVIQSYSYDEGTL